LILQKARFIRPGKKVAMTAITTERNLLLPSLALIEPRAIRGS
jgi:hypothetical protein